MKKNHSRVTYIAYGETDDFAHDGDYAAYLKSARQTDAFIQELWEFVQSDKFYQDKTTFIITTDHGRGTQPLDTWKSHGSDVKGAGQTWMAILGPNTPTMKEVSTKGAYYTNQIAPTVAALLGVDYSAEKQTGKVLTRAIETEKRVSSGE